MIYDLVHDGVGYSQMTEAQLAEAGVTAPVIAQAVADRRRVAIKIECARRIYAVASAATQQNMAAATALIAAKPASERSDADTLLLTAFAAALNWVQDMRAAVAQLAADPASDYVADAGWPACPPQVVALAEQF